MRLPAAGLFLIGLTRARDHHDGQQEGHRQFLRVCSVVVLFHCFTAPSAIWPLSLRAIRRSRPSDAVSFPGVKGSSLSLIALSGCVQSMPIAYTCQAFFARTLIKYL